MVLSNLLRNKFLRNEIYLGLANKIGDVFYEPGTKDYKRVKLIGSLFKYDNNIDVYLNNYIIFFDESLSNWGKISNLIAFNENGEFVGSGKLEKFVNIYSRTSLRFPLEHFKVWFNN